MIDHILPPGDDPNLHVRQPNCQCMPSAGGTTSSVVFRHISLTSVLNIEPYPHESEQS